jgi:hypothetical protein
MLVHRVHHVLQHGIFIYVLPIEISQHQQVKHFQIITKHLVVGLFEIELNKNLFLLL